MVKRPHLSLFLTCCLLVVDEIKMGKHPKAEIGSCRKQKCISEFSYCPPCWEQHNKSYQFFKYNDIETTGCCHLLYNNKMEGWKPFDTNDVIWKHPNWNWSGGNSSSEVACKSSNETRVTRAAPTRFEAGPAAGAKMLSHLESNMSRRRQERRFKSEKTLNRLVLSVSKQQMGEVMLPTILNELKTTKNGRNGIAKAITGLSTISLPSGGTSKAATNKTKKSALALVTALSSTLAPDKREQLFQSVFPQPQQATQTKTLSSSFSSEQPPMKPRNPNHLSSQGGLIPTRKRQMEEMTNMTCQPCSAGLPISSTTTTTTTNFRQTVTLESLDDMITSDSEGDVDDTSSTTSSSPNDSSSSDDSSLDRHKARRYAKRMLARKSMQGVTNDEVENVIKSLGTELIEYVKEKCRTASESRPYVALVANKYKRKHVNNALGTYINKFEWRKSQIHAKWPGALKPVKKQQSFKLRIKRDILMKLLGFLDSPGNLQRLAFGRQVKDMLGGLETVEIDNVLRSKKMTTLITQFLTGQMREINLITTKDGELVPIDKDRCPKLDPKTTFRCLKRRCHDGKCNFTPKGSVSPSSIRQLVMAMAPSEVKSLAGLDDTKVTKGRDNFIRLKAISKLLCDGEELQDIVKRIDATEVFYQTDYVNHLARKGTHKCNCLTCGFHDKDSPTDILCSDRNLHAPSCKKCTDGFAIISTLLEIASNKLHDVQQSFAAADKSPPSTTTPANPPLQEPNAAAAATATATPDFASMSFKLLKTACLERDLVQNGGQAVIVERLINFENSKQTGAPIKWESFTSDFLKKACKERGLTQGGKRDDVILKIKNHDSEQEEIARTTIPLRDDFSNDDLVTLQSASEPVHELERRKQDLVEYRSHLARHLSEEEYANEQVKNLKDDEAIVTSDFKMKILSCYYRENQKKWFGKRGTSCLGFMITTNPEDEASKAKGIKDVTFVMMITNDGIQDDSMVACAKFRIYMEYLPKHIKVTHFVSDGAGCFKSQLHRAIQDLWEVWTGIKEATYRITPAGDGKSSLDGMFGRLNYTLRGSVDEGSSYHNAETIAAAIEKSNGLASTQIAIFVPDRSKQLEVTFSKFNFEAILLSKLDPSRPGGLVTFKHSGYGSGQNIDLVKDVDFSWRKNSGNTATKRTGDVSAISHVYNNDRTKNIGVVMTMKPLCSEFTRTENMKSFMTTKLASRGSGAGDAAVRGRKKKLRVEAKADSKKRAMLKEREEMQDAGLFLYNAQCTVTGRFCLNIYQSAKALTEHKKHTFPKGQNARDVSLREASKPGGVVEAGARPDRQSKKLFENVVSADDGARGEVDSHCFGKFNRKENVIGYKKPQKLLGVLEYLYGLTPKLRAVEFREGMSTMKDEEKGGLLFCYEKRNTNGLLLSIDQIQSWINTRTQQKKNSEKHIRTEKDLQEDALLDQLRSEQQQSE